MKERMTDAEGKGKIYIERDRERHTQRERKRLEIYRQKEGIALLLLTVLQRLQVKNHNDYVRATGQGELMEER